MAEIIEYKAHTFLRELSELGLARHRPIDDKREDFEIWYLDLSPLKLRTSRYTPFLVPRGLSASGAPPSDRLKQLILEFREYAKGVRDDFAVLLAMWNWEESWQSVRDELGAYQAAILDLGSMIRFAAAPDLNAKLAVLGMELARSLGVKSLSPYVLRKPAVAGRFFGRSVKLDKMLSGRKGENFTIVGNRRIGKTSLLSEIKDRLSSRTSSKAITFAWLVGGLFTSKEEVIRRILIEIGAPKEADKIDNHPRRVLDFPNILRDFAEREQVLIAVFMDEIDRVLEFDERDNNQLLSLFKAAFEPSEIRIFLGGFRRAIQAYYDLEHPLYNFTQIEVLGCLTSDETLEMVRIPLQRLGIKMTDSRLAPTIYAETGGHPELIQKVCNGIIDAYDATGTTPSADDVLAKLYESEFEQAVYQTFLANTSPFERALCYLLIQDANRQHRDFRDYEFSVQEVTDVLLRGGLGHMSARTQILVRNLDVSSILRKTRGAAKWVFAVPQLARYCAHNDIDEEVKHAVEDAQSAPDSAMIMWPDLNMGSRKRPALGTQ